MIWEAMKRQSDGVSFKVREFEKKLANQPPPTTEPVDTFDNYEQDEEKKIEKTAEKILTKQNRERSEYYIGLARNKLVKFIKEKKVDIDLTDDYAWQEFISGVKGADNPKERPLYTHRQDPISGCYLDIENPFKDMLEHFYKRYPEYKSSGDNTPSPEGSEEFSIDTTPSSDTTEMSKQSSRLSPEEKKAAKNLGMTDEEYSESKKKLEEKEGTP